MPTEWVEEWVATKNEFLDNPARNVMGFKITGPGAARLLELRKQMGADRYQAFRLSRRSR